MPRTVTTQEATIEIMQVEIQVLKVGKKQVTMGMFRQLPHAPLIDPETMQLRGVPWGHVNYWWESDGRPLERGPCLHVVWQSEDVLYRSVVSRTIPRRVLQLYDHAIQSVMDEVYIWLAGSTEDFTSHHTRDGVIKVQWHGFQWEVLDSDTGVPLAAELLRKKQRIATYLAHNNGEPAAWWVEELRVAQELYDKHYASRGFHAETSTELLRRRKIHQERRDELERRWAGQWQTLSALPQLFIAV